MLRIYNWIQHRWINRTGYPVKGWRDKIQTFFLILFMISVFLSYWFNYVNAQLNQQYRELIELENESYVNYEELNQIYEQRIEDFSLFIDRLQRRTCDLPGPECTRR